MTALSFRAFVDLLRCPDCREGFAFTPTPQPPEVRGEYGTLTCACYEYPVVSSIPILKKLPVTVNSISDARVVLSGPTPEELVGLIQAGEGLEGLLRLVAFPVCPWPLNRFQVGRALSQAEPFRSAGLALRRRALHRRLRSGFDGLTAEDWLDTFYWRSPTLFDPFNYLFFRFGQPRHLAALSLVAALPVREKPVMDLACGYGHLLHYLTTRGEPHRAIGFDQNFHQVWVAKHWIAPAAQFVCGDAEQSLPFANAALSASLCTDAFHHIRTKAACVAELRRCTSGGTLVFAGTGNRLVEPLEGEEYAPEEYAALLAPWPHRIRQEAELLDGYLRGVGPDLTLPMIREGATEGKWLYFVATEDPSFLQRHGRFDTWPHATGHLTLNPLYERRPQHAGSALTFRFPSPWYAFENARMTGYHPEAASLGADVLADVAAGRRSAGVKALIEQFVVLGLPQRYARPSGRPWVATANRALTFFVRNLTRRYRDTTRGYRAAIEGGKAVRLQQEAPGGDSLPAPVAVRVTNEADAQSTAQ